MVIRPNIATISLNPENFHRVKTSSISMRKFCYDKVGVVQMLTEKGGGRGLETAQNIA